MHYCSHSSRGPSDYDWMYFISYLLLLEARHQRGCHTPLSMEKIVILLLKMLNACCELVKDIEYVFLNAFIFMKEIKVLDDKPKNTFQIFIDFSHDLIAWLTQNVSPDYFVVRLSLNQTVFRHSQRQQLIFGRNKVVCNWTWEKARNAIVNWECLGILSDRMMMIFFVYFTTLLVLLPRIIIISS